MKIKGLNLKKLLTSLLLVLISTALFSLLIIATPQSEKILQDTRYDLTLSQPWRKEYSLKLTIKNEDVLVRDKKVAETKEILFNRLNKYGVEEVTITEESGDSTSAILKIVVQSSKDIDGVDALISQRYFMRLVTRKADVDFNDESDPLAPFNRSNYESTMFTRRYFRSVYVTQLDNTLGEKSYFAIFKPWFFRTSEFDQFVAQNAAREAGLSIDGFVTPITIPVGQASQTGIITKPVFAIGLNINEQQARIHELLMNSGVIPLEYQQTETKDLNPKVSFVNHIEVVLTIIAATIAFTIFFIAKREFSPISNFILPTILTWSIWITYLKLSQTPTDTTLLLLQFMTLSPITYLLSQIKRNSWKIYTATALLLLIIAFLAIGYIKDFTHQMIVILIISYMCKIFSNWYINMSKSIMR